MDKGKVENESLSLSCHGTILNKMSNRILKEIRHSSQGCNSQQRLLDALIFFYANIRKYCIYKINTNLRNWLTTSFLLFSFSLSFFHYFSPLFLSVVPWIFHYFSFFYLFIYFFFFSLHVHCFTAFFLLIFLFFFVQFFFLFSFISFSFSLLF